jgi:hypothetical protein
MSSESLAVARGSAARVCAKRALPPLFAQASADLQPTFVQRRGPRANIGPPSIVLGHHKIQENPMTKHAFCAVAVAALSMTALSAHAGCADPRLPGQQTATPQPTIRFFSNQPNQGHRYGPLLDRIVGTWQVTYTGALAGQAFIQWHSDGTEWENIAYPILGGTICMGDWTAVDENHVRRSHVGWLFANGLPFGYFTETETDEVASDGSWYRGTNYAKFYDLDGNSLGEGGGTAEARRIAAP